MYILYNDILYELQTYSHVRRHNETGSTRRRRRRCVRSSPMSQNGLYPCVCATVPPRRPCEHNDVHPRPSGTGVWETCAGKTPRKSVNGIDGENSTAARTKAKIYFPFFSTEAREGLRFSFCTGHTTERNEHDENSPNDTLCTSDSVFYQVSINCFIIGINY